MKVRALLSNFGQLELILLLVLGVLAFRAYNDVPINTYSEETLAKNSFNEYKDTTVNLEVLNAFTNTVYKKADVGTPIQLMGSPYVIIPLGSWSMELSSKSLQGTAIEKVNPMQGIPYRSVTTVLKGPFGGLVKFNLLTNEFSWVQPTSKIDSIVYVRSKSQHFIMLEAAESNIRLKDILNDFEVSYHSPSEILDWCVLPTSDSLYVIEQIADKTVLKKLPFTPSNSTDN